MTMDKHAPLPGSTHLLDDLESIRQLLGDADLQPPLLTDTVEQVPARVDAAADPAASDTAQDDPQAVPALTRAAGLAEDGTLDVSLAQSYQNLYEWESCVDSAREGISKGDLRREDQAYMILGACLFEQKEYTSARNAFEEAAEDERSRSNARSWIQYVNSEQARDEELAAALAR